MMRDHLKHLSSGQIVKYSIAASSIIVFFAGNCGKNSTPSNIGSVRIEPLINFYFISSHLYVRTCTLVSTTYKYAYLDRSSSANLHIAVLCCAVLCCAVTSLTAVALNIPYLPFSSLFLLPFDPQIPNIFGSNTAWEEWLQLLTEIKKFSPGQGQYLVRTFEVLAPGEVSLEQAEQIWAELAAVYVRTYVRLSVCRHLSPNVSKINSEK